MLVGLLHADRDRLGDGAYTLLIGSPVLPRAHLAAASSTPRYETIRASAGILLIVAVAALFGWILVGRAGAAEALTALMLTVSTNPYVLLLIVNLLLLVVGMFLDQHDRDPASSRRSSPSRWSPPASTRCTSAWWWCST